MKFNTSELNRTQKRKSVGSSAQISKRFTRQAVCDVPKKESICFFCDKTDKMESLHEASSFQMDARVRESVMILQDERLLAKLSAGDLVAQEAKYHLACLASLHQKAKLESANKTFIQDDAVSHALALAGLVEYIEEFRHSTEVAAIFKLSDLAKLYTARFENLGLTSAGRIHTTRLKERMLARIPDLKAYVEGRDTLITFEKNVGLALKKATEDDLDDDAMYLVKVAKIVRKEMQEIKTKLDGTFTPKCQNQAVPDSLIALVAMIFDGPSIVDQNNVSGISQPALTIAQLIKFNFHSRRQ